MNGKVKGASFERWVCKRLSLWVTRQKREDVFWRSAMSGGRATLGMRAGKDLRRQAGDICSVAPEGHSLTEEFYIECKHLKNIGVVQLLTKGSGPLLLLCKKTIHQAQEHQKEPMLILRQNKWPDLVIVFGGSSLRHGWDLAKIATIHHKGLPDVVVLSFKHLLRCRYA